MKLRKRWSLFLFDVVIAFFDFYFWIQLRNIFIDVDEPLAHTTYNRLRIRMSPKENLVEQLAAPPDFALTEGKMGPTHSFMEPK